MFKLRMKILVALAVLIAAILTLRLADLQLRRGTDFRTQLETRQIVLLAPVPARRGRILAQGPGRTGRVELVTNQPAYELAVVYPVMDPDPSWRRSQLRLMRSAASADKTTSSKPSTDQLSAQLDQRIAKFWAMIAQLTGLPPDQLHQRRDRITQLIRRRIDAVRQRRAQQDAPDGPILEQRIFHPILTDLDDQRALHLLLNLADQPWAIVKPSSTRTFPQHHTLCHILGRVYRIPGSLPKTYTQLDDEDLPGEMRGLSQLEQKYNSVLRGSRGWAALTQQPEIRIDPVHGRDIVLTIDIELQKHVEQLLRNQLKELEYATAAAAVVIDLTDNSLLALASIPTYDCQTYSDNFEKLSGDHRYRPLLNRAMLSSYPPGSIVKPLVAQIALQRGAIAPDRHYDCPGYLIPGHRAFRCWRSTGHGSVDTVEAISQSCDVFFYKVGESLTAQRLTAGYRSFGLGAKLPGITLPHVTGRVPTSQWFIEHHSRPFGPGDARNLAVGQGDLLVTPLQAANMLSTLLTGSIRPVTLVATSPSATPPTPVHLEPRYLPMLHQGMVRTINHSDGTGYDYARSDRVKLAGKTGSAQVPPPRWWPHDPATDDRSQHPAHAWFIGYAPADAPKVVITVFVEYGMSGGRAAGPVFRDIAHKCLDLNYLH